MSYILDALRKADAERERDPARGIHAQPAALPAETPRRVAPFVVGAAALVVVGAGAAWVLRPAGAPGAPTVAAAVAAPVVATVPVAAPVAPVAPAPVAQAPAPVVIPVATAVSPPAPPPLPAPAPVAPKAAPAVVAKAAPAVPATAPAAPVPAPVAAPVAERVLAYAELPPEVQRELPKVQISGGVHSENAAQRMLIVGGQVMNEGAEIAPGVFIEQIRPRTAVLKFRGYRYSVGY